MGFLARLFFGGGEDSGTPELETPRHEEDAEAGEAEATETVQEMAFPVPDEIALRPRPDRPPSVTANALEAMRRHAAERTSRELGDRNTYVGASDIGGCLRKAFLEKRFPPLRNLETLMRFERGHIAEAIVAKMIDFPAVYQHEIVSSHNGVELRCHIDFLVNTGEWLVATEAKSINGTLSAPYDSWVRQVHYQMAMVRKEHPEAKVGGKVVAVDVNTGWKKEFDIPWDDAVYRDVVRRTEAIVAAMLTGVEPPAEPQFYCGSCPFKEGCVAYRPPQELPEELAAKAREAAEASRRHKAAAPLRKAIEAWMAENGLSAASAGDLVVRRVEGAEYASVDVDALKKEHPIVAEAYKKTVRRDGYVYFQ